jgi:hypothetical protein
VTPLIEPICLPCYRRLISMTGDPPRAPGWPEETCALCGRRTNHGIYVDHMTCAKLREHPDQEN